MAVTGRRAPTIFDGPPYAAAPPPQPAPPAEREPEPQVDPQAGAAPEPRPDPAPVARSLAPPVRPRRPRGERKPREPRQPRDPEQPREPRKLDPTTARVLAATVVRALCTLAALVLVGSALVLVAQANQDNALVTFLARGADLLDLGVFDVDNGVMQFTGDRADLKDALFNRALAALVWLLAGRFAGRALAGRPTPRP